jgi:hypothetical protein
MSCFNIGLVLCFNVVVRDFCLLREERNIYMIDMKQNSMAIYILTNYLENNLMKWYLPCTVRFIFFF